MHPLSHDDRAATLEGAFANVQRTFMVQLLTTPIVPAMIILVQVVGIMEPDGFKALADSTYRPMVAVFAAAAVGLAWVVLVWLARPVAHDGIAIEPDGNGEAGLARRLTQLELRKMIAANLIGMLGLILVFVRGDLRLYLAFVCLQLAVFVFGRPLWQRWSDARNRI